MAAASAARKNLPMFVIGQSTKPQCFENIEQLLADIEARR